MSLCPEAMLDPFDQLAKRIAVRALSPWGPVAVEHEVAPNAKAVDVWFQPCRASAAKRRNPDLLDRMTPGPSILEAFHNTPGIDDVRGCIHKQLGIDTLRCAEARRKKKRSRPRFPQLWIVSPGRPVSVVEGYGLSPLGGFPPGVLGRHVADALGMVVLRELPRERDTLLLRLMGAGELLREAISELIALPDGAREQVVALEDLFALRFQIPQDTTADREREYLMSTEGIEYWKRRFRDEGVQQGHERGLERGMKEALQTLYRSRFGELSPSIASAIEATHDPATLTRWVVLFGTASSADVAAALGQSNACPQGPA
jgi:hypothetical protein